MPRVYRLMQEENGRPKIERSANALGVRIDGKRPDIRIDADGSVKAEEGGMSVAPLPQYLPRHRVYRELMHIVEGAESKNASMRIWRMGDGPFLQENLTPDLLLLPDPAKEGIIEHGVITPAQAMPLAEYETALANTQAQWILDETGE